MAHLLQCCRVSEAAHTSPHSRSRQGSSKTVILLRAGLVVVTLVALFVSAHAAWAQVPLPRLTVEVGEASEPRDVAVTMQIVFLLTVLSLAPAILIMTTCYTRIIVVLSFLTRALGTQQTPSGQILAGLALFMTFSIMAPVWNEVNETAIRPYMRGDIKARVQEKEVEGRVERETIEPFYVALELAAKPIRKFMFKQLGEGGARDLDLFMRMSRIPPAAGPDDIPTRVLIPAFIISELKKAFYIGFMIFVPFLVIDMVTASVLMSMGMMMLPPILIALPFKLLLFILVDGWHLLVMNLAASFGLG